MKTLSFAEILACFPIVQKTYESEGRLYICIRPVYENERMHMMSEADGYAMSVIEKLAKQCNYSYLRIGVGNDGTETWSWLPMG